uniref:Uncharacterized protein n=1 Tax=Oryza meridionalis TaxID=40149 RepID=A0A0E0EEF3_9ORYZ
MRSHRRAAAAASFLLPSSEPPPNAEMKGSKQPRRSMDDTNMISSFHRTYGVYVKPKKNSYMIRGTKMMILVNYNLNMWPIS